MANILGLLNDRIRRLPGLHAGVGRRHRLAEAGLSRFEQVEELNLQPSSAGRMNGHAPGPSTPDFRLQRHGTSAGVLA